MTVNILDKRELNQLKQLWKIGFNDRDEDIDAFFDTLMQPENVVFKRIDGKIVAAAYLVDIKLSQGAEKPPLDGYYFCCAATLTEYRGRGLMSDILSEVAETAKKRNKSFVALIPANDGLFSFYQKAGFQDFFYCNTAAVRAEKTAGGYSFTKQNVSAEALAKIHAARSQNENCFILKDERIFEYTLLDARLSEYEIFLAESPDGKDAGFIVFDCNNSNPLVREVISIDCNEQNMAAEFASFAGLKSVEVRLPATKNSGRRKGMLLDLSGITRSTDISRTLPFINNLLEK